MPKPDTGFLIISADGESISGIYDDALSPLLSEGSTTIKRASHVEPSVAGGWFADMTPVEPGLVFSTTQTRQESLDREVAWLRSNYFGLGLLDFT